MEVRLRERAQALLAVAVVGALAYPVVSPAAPAAASGLWTISQPPAVGSNSGFFNVSCVSQSFCMAVGYATVPGSADQPMAEIWNGSNWIDDHALQISGSTYATPFSVSCPTTQMCMMVGLYENTSDPFSESEPFAEVWDGSQWSLATPPQPVLPYTNPPSSFPGGSESLTSVACISSVDCVAAGTTGLGNNSVATLDVWNGTSWTTETQSLPSPGEFTGFQAVSCTGSSFCMMVGGQAAPSGNPSGEISEPYSSVWDGNSVTSVPTIDPGNYFNTLYSVSCTGSNFCMSTGQSFSVINGLTYYAMSEEWNGSSWTLEANPTYSGTAGGGQIATLGTLSCVSPSACIALAQPISGGQYDDPLLEAWNGSDWTETSTLDPSGDITSMACLSVSFCVAGGVYLPTYGPVIETGPMGLPNDGDLVIAAETSLAAPARSPSGVAVSYVPPAASDEAGEIPPVTCDHPSGSIFPLGTTTVTCTATDTDDTPSSVSTTFTVSVFSNPPTVGPVSVPASPAAINSSVSASASFTDPGNVTAVAASWDWGDGSTSPGTVSGSTSSGTVAGSHAYQAAGVYTVTLTVTNGVGQSASATATMFVVVYDPSGGFVTGGGWLNSPSGAYAPQPSLTGRANFGFVAKYQKGANVPSGNTEFQLQFANFDFKSSSYQWLVVSGATAQYKGTGTINGTDGYTFMLTGCDAEVKGTCQGGPTDSLRMKIVSTSTGALVYDNAAGSDDLSSNSETIGGGDIVIHNS